MQAILNFFSDNFSTLSWLAVFIVAMLPIAEAKVAIPFGMAVEVWGDGALSPSSAALIAFVGSTIPIVFIILFLRPIFDYLKTTKVFHGMVVGLEKLFRRKSEREISISFFKNKKKNNQVETMGATEPKTKNSYYNVSVQNVYDKHLSRDEQKMLSNLVSGQTSQQKARISEHEILTQEFTKKEISNFKKLVSLLFFVALPLPLAGVWTSSAVAAFTDVKFWPAFFAIAFGNLIEVVFITVVCYLFKDSIAIVLIVSVVLLLIYIITMVVLNHRGKKILKQMTTQA